MPEKDAATEAFAEFVEHREAILLIHNAKQEGFEFSLTSGTALGYHCNFGTLLKGEWSSVGSGNGRTFSDAVSAAWAAVKQTRQNPIATSGDWAQAQSIVGELASNSVAYIPLPGCDVAFNMEAAKQVLIEAQVIERGNVPAAVAWRPSYQISVQVDGLQVIESDAEQPATASGYGFCHNVRGVAALAAGTHMVRVGFRLRDCADFRGHVISALPKHPARIIVHY